MSSKALLVELVEETGCVGHESRWFLQWLSRVGLLSKLALVGVDLVYAVLSKQIRDLRFSPRGRKSRVFVEKIGSSIYLSLIEMAAPFEMYPGLLNFRCHNVRITFGFVQVLDV